MADPFTLAAITAVSAIGTGVLGYSQAQYQGKVASMNAQIAEENAKRAVERSQIEAEDSDMQTRLMLGEQVAEQAASGLSLTSKSFMQTRQSTRILGRRDALNILQGGELEAYNYRTQKAGFQAQKQASTLTGIGSLVSGVGTAASAFSSRSLVGASRPTAVDYRRLY